MIIPEKGIVMSRISNEKRTRYLGRRSPFSKQRLLSWRVSICWGEDPHFCVIVHFGARDWASASAKALSKIQRVLFQEDLQGSPPVWALVRCVSKSKSGDNDYAYVLRKRNSYYQSLMSTHRSTPIFQPLSYRIRHGQLADIIDLLDFGPRAQRTACLD